jgi:hypothetical protein
VAGLLLIDRLMKIVRVPWIRCRADELDTSIIPVAWRKQTFSIMAHSQQEAEKWWGNLSDAERHEVLGLDQQTDGDQSTLF